MFRTLDIEHECRKPTREKEVKLPELNLTDSSENAVKFPPEVNTQYPKTEAVERIMIFKSQYAKEIYRGHGMKDKHMANPYRKCSINKFSPNGLMILKVKGK